MEITTLIISLLLVACAVCAVLYARQLHKRNAYDVWGDLLTDRETSENYDATILQQVSLGSMRKVLISELGSAGILTPSERMRFIYIQKIIPPILATLLIFISILLSQTATVSTICMMAILGLALGYLITRRRIVNTKSKYMRSLEFFLPVVMERVVMAVQSGLDVIPALHAVFSLDAKTTERTLQGVPQTMDPVSRLLQIVVKLTESGLSFEQSLREVAELTDCVAVKHAFIHLAVAQREGGELVGPLRELSDSTQLYYQESIDEEIAKMPIRATMPLLCTFAGLIIMFITSPLIQVISMTSKLVPK